ncbi:MAG: hypothetical protein M0C28_24085 [Candidatus Moduliflexus flocculans]|nr:hypothetical protein [Candidatus Moduliflexus flocculans]
MDARAHGRGDLLGTGVGDVAGGVNARDRRPHAAVDLDLLPFVEREEALDEFRPGPGPDRDEKPGDGEGRGGVVS